MRESRLAGRGASRPDPATRLTAPPATDGLDRLGDEIAALAAHLDAATARFLTLLRDFDARDGWQNGCRSCAEWLVWRAGLDPGAARERVRVARALGDLPGLAAALARGEVSLEDGFAAERAFDGTLRFRTPAGRPILEAPPAPAVPAEPIRALVAGHRALGLAIHGRTGCGVYHTHRDSLAGCSSMRATRRGSWRGRS